MCYFWIFQLLNYMIPHLWSIKYTHMASKSTLTAMNNTFLGIGNLFLIHDTCIIQRISLIDKSALNSYTHIITGWKENKSIYSQRESCGNTCIFCSNIHSNCLQKVSCLLKRILLLQIIVTNCYKLLQIVTNCYE